MHRSSTSRTFSHTCTGGFTHYGDNVDSGGFNFASILHGGDPISIASWTTDSPDYTGSIAIFANYFGDGLIMTESTRDGGAGFSVCSIDMADIFLDPTGDIVTFTGIHTDLGIAINVIPLTDGRASARLEFAA